MTRKASCLTAVALLSLAETLSAATITDFTVTGDASKLTIGYTIDAEAYVTGDVLIGGESIGASLGSFVGTVNEKVAAGTYTAYWFPTVSIPGRQIAEGELKVRLSVRDVTDPPDYLVHNLSRATPRLKYYDNTNAIPGGITSDRYKLDYVVLRRIPGQEACWQMDGKRWVTLSHDFWMGVYPVTQRQYSLVRGTSGVPPQFSDYDDSALHPVSNVSSLNLEGWQQFYNNGNEYREWSQGPDNTHFFYAWRRIFPNNTPPMSFYLPTEAQWAFACGDGVSSSAADFGDYVWHSGNSDGKTHPVGLKKPNGYGLYDMQGNVAELTLDGWVSDLGIADAMDPYVKPSDRSNKVTYRGGSWNDAPDGCLGTSRFGMPYQSSDVRCGFRICSTIFSTTTRNSRVDYDAALAPALDTRTSATAPGTLATFDSVFGIRVISNVAELYGVRPGALIIFK